MRPGVWRVKLKHLSQSGVFSSGNPRLYYRPKGSKGIALPDLPVDHPKFLAAYAKAAGMATTPLPPNQKGTIGAAVVAFLASSEFASKSPATRANWRRAMDRIRLKYGHAPLHDLAARHIVADLSPLKPHPANNRLKVWRAACSWWSSEQMKTNGNPAAEVKRRKVPKSKGFIFWKDEDVTRFRDYWHIGTPERLAFELLHWTGARMCDAVRLTEGHIGTDGWLTYTQAKTETTVNIPFNFAPEYAESSGLKHLHEAIRARPERHLVFMVTRYGKPRSIKAASAWFAAAARAAGISGKSAHGLRKCRANIMAQNGATTKQLAAWLGHQSLAMVQHYSKGADQRRTIMGTAVEQKSSNFSQEVPKTEVI